MQDERFSFIGGAGRIGTAVIGGLLSSNVLRADHIVVTARHRKSLERAAHLGVRGTLDNQKAVSEAEVVVLCVHPPEVDGLLDEIRAFVRPDQLVLSLVTGVTTGHIEKGLGQEIAVVRAMPNIAVFVGASMTAMTRGRWVSDDQIGMAVEAMESVGQVEVLDERHMNACTALGACGPAFVFKIIEALSEGGVKVGLPREASRKMAAQALRGAAALVLETGRHPAALKDDVTTPGGCTIDGITKLEERGLPIALIEAVEASTWKAGLLFEKDD